MMTDPRGAVNPCADPNDVPTTPHPIGPLPTLPQVQP